jgi:WD40 repeat protein
MCQSTEDLKRKADWDGAGGNSRQHLLSDLSRKSKIFNCELASHVPLECISPAVMLPEHRLAVLLQQVKHSQISRCLYHNTASSPSLYQDHNCDQSNFPVNSFIELSKHTGEVWQVVFSHDGKSLASCGEDGTAIIYDSSTFEVLQTLADHEMGISAVSWSPDDSLIVTCSQDKRARLWDATVSIYLYIMATELIITRPATS